jgi:hypothetical protein
VLLVFEHALYKELKLDISQFVTFVQVRFIRAVSNKFVKLLTANYIASREKNACLAECEGGKHLGSNGQCIDNMSCTSNANCSIKGKYAYSMHLNVFQYIYW